MAAAGADPRSAIAPITCDTTGTREKALASLLEQIMDSYSVSDDEKPLAAGRRRRGVPAVEAAPDGAQARRHGGRVHVARQASARGARRAP